MEEKKVCCICGKEYTGFGNNPWPIIDDEDSMCCDECNTTKVVPERIHWMRANNLGEYKQVEY